jgi:hypothetical protein
MKRAVATAFAGAAGTAGTTEPAGAAAVASTTVMEILRASEGVAAVF